MSILITADDGTEHEGFARFAGGMVDVLVRADTKQQWLDAAVARNLLDEVTNDDGSTATQVRVWL